MDGWTGLSLSLAAALCAGLCLEVSAASPRGSRKKAARVARQDARAEGTLKLSEAERELVRGSRAAFVTAGFSEGYFDRHFTPFKVFDRPGDRRVVWRFRAGAHEAYVNDSVGSYRDAQGRRVDTHSVASTLGAARDIRPAVSRRRAERLMRACIGEFEGGAVVFQQLGPRARTALVFTATSAPAAEATGAKGAAGAQVSAPPAPQPARSAQSDAIRRGGRKRPPVYVGAVDLETGRCVKGRAQAGAPRPDDDAPTRPRNR
jgi:hypothetical protein